MMELLRIPRPFKKVLQKSPPVKRGNARGLFGSTLTPLTRKVDLNRGAKGLRGRNSPTCTLSQNGYGTPFGG